MSEVTISHEARRIVRAAEHAHSASAVEKINRQLHSDVQHLSQADYRSLLGHIDQAYQTDFAQNAGLPKLSFVPPGNSETLPEQIFVQSRTAQEIEVEEAYRKIKKDDGTETTQNCQKVEADLNEFNRALGADQHDELVKRLIDDGVTSHCELQLPGLVIVPRGL